MNEMSKCDGCSFCCWSFAVEDIPQHPDLKILKPAQTHCDFELEGCAIHNDEQYPHNCRVFRCPYLDGEDIHRPDTFQSVLEELGGNIGNYIPSIPRSVPVQRAVRLVCESRSILAVIILDAKWVRVAMPLDREEDGSWYPTQQVLEPWTALCLQYGVELVAK